MRKVGVSNQWINDLLAVRQGHWQLFHCVASGTPQYMSPMIWQIITFVDIRTTAAEFNCCWSHFQVLGLLLHIWVCCFSLCYIITETVFCVVVYLVEWKRRSSSLWTLVEYAVNKTTAVTAGMFVECGQSTGLLGKWDILEFAGDQTKKKKDLINFKNIFCLDHSKALNWTKLKLVWDTYIYLVFVFLE